MPTAWRTYAPARLYLTILPASFTSPDQNFAVRDRARIAHVNEMK
jgi:hypothetical protein